MSRPAPRLPHLLVALLLLVPGFTGGPAAQPAPSAAEAPKPFTRLEYPPIRPAQGGRLARVDLELVEPALNLDRRHRLHVDRHLRVLGRERRRELGDGRHRRRDDAEPERAPEPAAEHLHVLL